MPGVFFGLVVVALGVGGWYYLQWQKQRGEERRAHAAKMAAELRQRVLSRRFDAARPDAVGGTTGAAMDMLLPGGLATLVALDDDTVSLYLNPGGGMIGAGSHASVARAAAEFRALITRLQPRLSPATVFPGPPPGDIVFYLLTNTATLSSGPIMEKDLGEKDLNRDAHAFAPAYRAAHEVIAAMRQLDR